MYDILINYFTYKKVKEHYNFLCNTHKTFNETFETILNSDSVNLEHNILLLLTLFFILSLLRLIFTVFSNFLITIFIFYITYHLIYLSLKLLYKFIYIILDILHSHFYHIIKKIKIHLLGKINYIKEFGLNSFFFNLLTNFENDNTRVSFFLKITLMLH